MLLCFLPVSYCDCNICSLLVSNYISKTIPTPLNALVGEMGLGGVLVMVDAVEY
jgi:hypothetical protein